MQSDWQNKTACCTSHMKHKYASLTLISRFPEYEHYFDLPSLLLCNCPISPNRIQIVGRRISD